MSSAVEGLVGGTLYPPPCIPVGLAMPEQVHTVVPIGEGGAGNTLSSNLGWAGAVRCEAMLLAWVRLAGLGWVGLGRSAVGCCGLRWGEA